MYILYSYLWFTPLKLGALLMAAETNSPSDNALHVTI